MRLPCLSGMRERGRSRFHGSLAAMPAFALCAFFALAMAEAAETGQPAEPIPEYIKVSVTPWFSSGMGRFQISFPLDNSIPKSEIATGSTLEFQDKNNLMYLVAAEIRPHRRFSFDFQYGDSNFNAGFCRDHDWIDAANYIITFQPSGNVYETPHQTDLSLSQSSLSGRTTVMSVDGYARLIYNAAARTENDTIYHNLDLLLGYSWYDDRFRMRNLVQLLSTGDLPTPPPGPIPGQDSTYNFHWEGFKMGLREELTLPYGFHAAGAFAYSPFVNYRGEGFWNLRNDLRRTPPCFVHIAHGSLYEGRLSVGYSPIRALSADFGYLIMYYNAKSGTDTTYFADGTETQVDLDRVWSERKGWNLTVSLKF